jgi:hypothetical protein
LKSQIQSDKKRKQEKENKKQANPKLLAITNGETLPP